MEISASLIGVVMLLLVAIPVGYMIVSAGSANKKIKKSVIQRSQNSGIQLADLDVIGNLVIGLDSVSKKLVYTSKRNPSGDFEIVNMEDVKKCRAKSVKQSDKTLDWVGLEFEEKTGKKEITFYNEHADDALSKDPFVSLQDAKRWEAKLIPLLKVS
ncbi:hypothetical protein [Aequorivita marina]|uniref:hypothetical protein n=1 Tax=Aequorivita marina TaxID=3073654 RepID=UPI0028740B7C|nr:hypothetical protein [Aequorivita sp. S2608]MDS1297456.1 hypothetical protein [Aequorivita sp. S2608]